jgi:hypothetical protein
VSNAATSAVDLWNVQTLVKTHAALITERMQQCAALMIERTQHAAVEGVDGDGPGLLWSVATYV